MLILAYCAQSPMSLLIEPAVATYYTCMLINIGLIFFWLDPVFLKFISLYL